MECIRILHIGDVHYPDTFNKHIVDMKDEGLSDDFVTKISPNPFERVSKELVKVLNNEDIKGVLLSGDLTSRGDLIGYEACVSHFMKLFLSVGHPEIDIHVVPGNHDLDRDEAISGDPKKKFDKFVNIWEKYGTDILSPDKVRQSSIEVNECKLQLYSLNTCVGCGETRGFPAKIRNTLEGLIKKSDLSDKDYFNSFCEQLDTPAADQDHVTEIEQDITIRSINKEIPVILAHHGLLPQPTVRTDIYTEMLNGGYVRSVLDTIKSAVIYCHGHIHQDPVEVIRQPKYDQSNLISISAPEFRDGFNIIEIYYSTKKVPIGCVVRPYRLQGFGSVREETKIPIKLTYMPNIDDCCHEQVEEVYKLIPTAEVRFGTLHDSIDSSDFSVNETELVTVLKELCWIGVIEIENIERSPKKWTVRRVGL